LFKAPSGEPECVSRILLIRLDRLGDFILSLPAVDSLRVAYPSAKIDVMVRPYLAGLAGMAPAINNVFVYKGIFDTFRSLPDQKYDVVIDMLRDYRLKPAFIALLSKAPVRIGFKGGFRERLFTHAVNDWKGSSKSMVDIDLELLKPLGVVPHVSIPKLARTPSPRDARAVIAIHPGGYYPSQRWPAKRFADLSSKMLEAFDISLVGLGGPDDRTFVDEIMARIPHQRAKAVFAGPEELVSILARSSMLICNNSGPLHLAAALGVPTVSTMGPTDPMLWWPKGDNQVVIRKAVKCSPCSLGKCREHFCMELITVDEVFGEVRNILEKVYGFKA
jgi:lipopolysaccharide heptosyltransferase II